MKRYQTSMNMDENRWNVHDLREFACELTSSWPPARVEPRSWPARPQQIPGLNRPNRPSSGRREFAVIYDDFETLCRKRVPKSGLRLNGTPKWTPWGPRRSTWTPKVSHDGPRDSKWRSKGAQSTPRTPKGDQNRPKSVPRGPQRCHKMAKGSPGGPTIWTNSRSTAQAAVMLIYE